MADIECYIEHVHAGCVTLTIYEGGENVPDVSNVLFSTDIDVQGATSTPGWWGFHGLNLYITSGTYWASFEPKNRDYYYGRLPSEPPSPLDNYAAYNPSLSPPWQSTAGSFGLRIAGCSDFACSDFIPGTVTIDFDPDTLNLNSKGKWIPCYIELPEGYDVGNIDINKVKLNVDGNCYNAVTSPTEIGDYNDNGIPDLMVKFNRELVQDAVNVGAVEITVLGLLLNEGLCFEGTDVILVIDKGKEHTNDEDHSSVEY